MMRLIEQQHLHIEKGHIDPAFFDSIDRTWFEWLTFPGVQEWWAGNREFYEPTFREYVERQVAKAKERGYESSFKETP
jgi:hypothetical protein